MADNISKKLGLLILILVGFLPFSTLFITVGFMEWLTLSLYIMFKVINPICIVYLVLRTKVYFTS